MKDQKTLLKVENALDLTTLSGAGSTVGEIIDRDGFEAVTFINRVDGHSAGAVTPLIEDGDDSALADASAVADAFLIGTEAEASLSADGVKTIGYVGQKKYVRMTLVAVGTSVDAKVSGLAIKGEPHFAPVA